MNIAICFVGTNVYRNFFPKYYNSIMSKFIINLDKTFFVFTDNKDDPVFKKENVIINKIENEGWPENTLFRYKYIDSIEEKIKEYDYFLFIDPDMFVVEEIKKNEIFTDKPFVGVQHPSFNNKDFDYRIGTFENRRESTAFIDIQNEDVSNYYQGCLWGGRTPEILDMIKELKNNVEIDEKNKIRALWFDESHLNRFMISNKDKVNTLDSGYCYPEKWNISFYKKIIHIDKTHLGIKK